MYEEEFEEEEEDIWERLAPLYVEDEDEEECEEWDWECEEDIIEVWEEELE